MNWKSISLGLVLFFSTFSLVNADVFDLWEEGKAQISEPVQNLLKKEFSGKTIRFLTRTKRSDTSSIVRFYLEENPQFNGWFFVDHTDTKIDWCGYTTQAPKNFIATDKGQLADIATTGVGLASGLVELNPIPLPILIPAKLAANELIKHQSLEACVSNITGLNVTGYAAAGWNLGMLAVGGPAAIIPAVALAYVMFPDVHEQLWSCANVKEVY